MQSMDSQKMNSDKVFLTCTCNLGVPKIVLDKETNENWADPMSGITGASSRQKPASSSKSLSTAQDIGQAVDER